MNRNKTNRRAARSAARRSQAGSGMAGKLVVMAAIVAAVVFGVAIFFKVGRVEIQGNTIYSAERITEASGLELGENLLMVNKGAVAGNVKAALPYVDQVSVGRILPDTVVISVRESQQAFCAQTDTNTLWLISPSGKALERIDASLQEDYPQLVGVTLNNPAAGQTVTAVNQTALDAALALLSALDGTGILEHAAQINVEKEYDIVLQYDDRYEVQLGSAERLDYKIQYLQAILEELSDYQAGVIDLTLAEANRAKFHPSAD